MVIAWIIRIGFIRTNKTAEVSVSGYPYCSSNRYFESLGGTMGRARPGQAGGGGGGGVNSVFGNNFLYLSLSVC